MTTECAPQAGVGSERPGLDQIEALALQMWRQRELQFPAYARRMTPDDIDRATGAWGAMLARAEAISRGRPRTASVIPFSR